MMKLAVVIPCYNVKAPILSVINRIGEEVSLIYVVDDKCPEQTGKFVESNCSDPRVRIIRHSVNKGVGGAVITGYLHALADGADIAIKIDGDGQMDPALIPRFVHPIMEGYADYTKGNRFFSPESLSTMPKIRLAGNAVLSFLTKLTSGYWNIMDPTNGYTAIHTAVLEMMPLRKIEHRYFFETDMLFRLNTIRAVVCDIPMNSHYGDETSHLNIVRVIREFPKKHLIRIVKRIYYNYYLRNFNICSVEILSSIVFIIFGTVFGLFHWYRSFAEGVPATTGTVMLAALPVILGFQMALSAIHFDVSNIPQFPIHKLFRFSNMTNQKS
ncbi:MAG: glycosyltransferase family 2 protein [Desulfococcaceae bacterium]